eukprot:CAMPEP_0182861590 /NCGR_PEP_ID=MMETSP0034_2-20130328/5584_1 /TAXON_ID=156128 /ORGANISM="Nephroselmis pyriformis, Strain CCMP717" /LENGTH=74 /DNA_ID=CAMNT_0024993543 /DNA_START=66 /DNA_END=287 /DNA_ORIENTATION=-
MKNSNPQPPLVLDILLCQGLKRRLSRELLAVQHAPRDRERTCKLRAREHEAVALGLPPSRGPCPLLPPEGAGDG